MLKQKVLNIFFKLSIILIFSQFSINSQGGRFVLAGGPFSGKSTSIKILHKLGFQIVQESFTQLYNNKKALGKEKDMFQNPQLLSTELLDNQLNNESKIDKNRHAFLDRCAWDSYFYDLHYKVEVKIENRNRVFDATYDIIFFLEQLPEDLFNPDDCRSEKDYAKATQIHNMLKSLYTTMGVKIIHVPFGIPEHRVAFILKKIKEFEAKQN